MVEERGKGFHGHEQRLKFECVAVVKRNGLAIAIKRIVGDESFKESHFIEIILSLGGAFRFFFCRNL